MDRVFCNRIERGEVLASNDLAAAFADGFSLSSGHCLIVPRRHEPDFLAHWKPPSRQRCGRL